MRGDLDDEEAKKDPESLSENIEEAKGKFVATISEKDKISEESINTQKVTNTSNSISQL